MTIENHALIYEFPEYKEKIRELKTSNHHFARLFAEYHELDRHIRRLEEEGVPVADETIEEMKKKRVLLKDELYHMLRQG